MIIKQTEECIWWEYELTIDWNWKSNWFTDGYDEYVVGDGWLGWVPTLTN